MSHMLITDLEQKLTLSLEFFASELTKIRTGRASSILVENIEVPAYGSKMKIKELGSIAVPEPGLILISPWDKSLLKEIDKALRESSLGVNPVTGSDSVKVIIPSLTEERRKELVKAIGVKLEECKTSIRNIRQDAMKEVDKAFSDKAIGEDEKFSSKEHIEEIIKKYSERAEEASDAKKEDVLKV